MVEKYSGGFVGVFQLEDNITIVSTTFLFTFCFVSGGISQSSILVYLKDNEAASFLP
jgi:hypothetical protein